MRRLFFLLLLGFLSHTGVALAQSDEATPPLQSTSDPALTQRQIFIENCRAAQRAEKMREKPKTCACEADYLASNMDDQQFAIMAGLIRFGADQQAISDWVVAQIEAGTWSTEKFLETANRLAELADGVGKACGAITE